MATFLCPDNQHWFRFRSSFHCFQFVVLGFQPPDSQMVTACGTLIYTNLPKNLGTDEQKSRLDIRLFVFPFLAATIC